MLDANAVVIVTPVGDIGGLWAYRKITFVSLCCYLANVNLWEKGRILQVEKVGEGKGNLLMNAHCDHIIIPSTSITSSNSFKGLTSIVFCKAAQQMYSQFSIPAS